ncbi:hypothetical protein EIP86_001895 [Pleurotus ostreatoroseus]|nr:hypothetical protein EIP86_001895 [Pleurotus ostreatoroseus]
MATEDDGYDSTVAHPVEDMAAADTEHLVDMEVARRPMAAGLPRDQEGFLLLHLRDHLLVQTHTFDLDTVKLLMSIFDTDRSGTIGFQEFAGLWKYIKVRRDGLSSLQVHHAYQQLTQQDWQNVFRHFDRDRSGSIDGRELHQALAQFGYNLSPQLLHLVERKYDVDKASGPVAPGGPPPGISFDRFVRACVVIKTLTEAFQKLDTDRDGWVQINYDQFMNTVLSAP